MQRSDVKQRVTSIVPFEKIDSLLQEKLERGTGRRNIVRNVEDYNNKVILGDGKRFRMALPYLMAKGMDVEIEDEKVLEAFTPIELVHGLSLILDDVMDRDEMRRGMQTPHKRFKDKGFTEKQAESLVTLDVVQLQSIAELSAHELDFLNAEKQIKVTEILGDAITKLSRGQMLDVAGENVSEGEKYREKLSYDGDFDYRKFYDDVIEGKTTPLFEAGPKILEVITDDELKNLIKYSKNLGRAFQIRDDVLDISGSEDQITVSREPEKDGIGKDRYSDLSEGTMTLPINYAFESMKENSWNQMEQYVKRLAELDNSLKSLQSFKNNYDGRKEFLNMVMSKERPESYELQIAGKIIEDTGALEEANKEALSYAGKAIENLKQSDVGGQYKDLLEDMAYFAATRSK